MGNRLETSSQNKPKPLLFSSAVDDIIGDIRTALFENSVIASQAMLESVEALKTILFVMKKSLEG